VHQLDATSATSAAIGSWSFVGHSRQSLAPFPITRARRHLRNDPRLPSIDADHSCLPGRVIGRRPESDRCFVLPDAAQVRAHPFDPEELSNKASSSSSSSSSSSRLFLISLAMSRLFKYSLYVLMPPAPKPTNAYASLRIQCLLCLRYLASSNLSRLSFRTNLFERKFE
jgi:hypothetical protein